MQTIAPPAWAQPWDNVGLMCGTPQQTVSHVLLCIDLTAAVVREAVGRSCDAVVSYHPPIFKSITSLSGAGPIAEAQSHRLAVYSPHTAWDVVPGGSNDVLADALGMRHDASRRSLRPAAMLPGGVNKLVFFAPEADCKRICDALFAAGAGHIGAYAHCSFQTRGTGTFMGAQHTQPAVGQPGAFTCAAEVRVEMVVPPTRRCAVIDALQAVHPYEEPAFELYTLATAAPVFGLGRVAELRQPCHVDMLIARLKAACGATHILHASPSQPAATVSRLAVCVGAGGELLAPALDKQCDVFVTGELRHHEALRAAAAGCHVLCTLHSHSERLSLAILAKRLGESVCLPVSLSDMDAEPFKIA